MNKSIDLVIYTVLTGDKESLGNPLENVVDCDTDLNLKFICFTDNKNLQSDVYEIRFLEDGYLPDDKMSRRPKALPHEYLPEWDWSLYIDNIVKFKRLPRLADINLASETGFILHRHATRKTPEEEAEVLVYIGYENESILEKQLDFYGQKAPFNQDDNFGTCTLMMRRHHQADIKYFGRIWWENILNFSKRDQISFEFSKKMSGIKVSFYDRLIDESDLVYPPANAAPGRVKSNFDEKKYAWRNKDIFSGISAKAHFLRSKANDSDYCVKSSMFEFLTYKNNSSLGLIHSPRRNVANHFEQALCSFRKISGNLLLVKTNSDDVISLDDSEFLAASKSFIDFFPFLKFHSIDIEMDNQIRNTDSLRTDGISSDALVFLNFPAAGFKYFASKYFSALNENSKKGFIFLMATSSLNIEEIGDVSRSLKAILSQDVKGSIFGTSHDSLDENVQNSCFILSWGS